MALGLLFICDKCKYTIEAWDEGNPYCIDEAGKKYYIYHPAPERSQCIGIDIPSICLDCGEIFENDSRNSTDKCPSCKSHNIIDIFSLDNQPCPYCKKGAFFRDPDNYKIS